MADDNNLNEKIEFNVRKSKKTASTFGWAQRISQRNIEIPKRTQVLTKASFHFQKAAALFYHALSREFEAGLAFHFAPVFIGIGIITYYMVPNEPLFLVLITTLILLLAVLQALRIHGLLYYVLAALFSMMLGMFAAKLETTRNAAPIIERQLTAHIEGIVLNVDKNRRGAPRYLIKPIAMEGLARSQLPERIRASAIANHETIAPGDGITGRIRVQPVSGPVYPHGYDFSFFAWQNGLGGSGFFMGKPEKLDAQTTTISWLEHTAIHINQLRKAIEARVQKALPDYTGGIAIALITGNRTGIPQNAQESLRNTGLAHILAISGLHMALVSLTLIATIRFLLTLNSHLTQHYPIKKWAVIAGFISATIYLFLSGGAIATQRAWIMISVMLLAILLDRKGITIRSVVISAIIILLVNPSSLLSPGFQMSFAAVASLVAGYEVVNKRRQKHYATQPYQIAFGKVRQWAGDMWRYFAGIATTSLIAGTATAFIAAWHFHQVAPLGLVANLMAMPIVALVVMPSLLGGMILMPYGLETVPFAIGSVGIDWIINIATWVELRSPDGNTGLLSRHMLLIFALLLSILTLMKTWLRLLSISLLPLLLLGFQNVPPPDIIIAENGRAIGVKSNDDRLVFLYPRASKFTQDIWQNAWGREERDTTTLKIKQCDREQCISILPDGRKFYLVYDPDLLRAACHQADILVAPRLWWVRCKERAPELVLKRHDFEQYGTHSIYLNAKDREGHIKVVRALPEPSRPWHRLVSKK